MKKPTAIQISTPQPCTQDWNEMQPVQGGRHCTQCQKAVVDFTWMTDAQMLAYFQKPDSAACGRFTAEQLDRTIKAVEVPRSTWWARVAAGLLLLLGLSKTAEGQSNRRKVPLEQILPTSNHVLKEQSVDELNADDFQLEKAKLITVSGTLTDYDGNPIIDGKVNLYGMADTSLGQTITGLDGEYSITVEIVNRIFSVGFSFLAAEMRYKNVFNGNPVLKVDGQLSIRCMQTTTVGLIMRSYQTPALQPPGQRTIRAEMLERGNLR